MVDANHRIRFMYQNLLELSSATKSFSSESSPMVFTNALNRFRSKYWTPSGNFTIEASNSKLYINDGADKTVTVPVANYSTPAALALAIETALNAASANWDVSYEATFSFKITHTTGATLRFSQTVDAIWSTIGYVSTVDSSGTIFLADEIRNHTSEFCVVDFGYNATVNFLGLIGLIEDDFTISTDGQVRIRANNLNDFTAAPLDIYATVTRSGVFEFLPDGTSPYRYWRIDFIDKKNTNGPTAFKFSNLFMGDYFTFTNKNIGNGLEESIKDPSKQTTTENGTKYFERKAKFSEFSSTVFTYIDRDQKQSLIDMFKEVGITLPFYVSFDPLKKISSTPDQYTRYVNWKDEPSFKQVVRDLHNVSLSFEEVI